MELSSGIIRTERKVLGTKHFVIPDTQCKDGVPEEHLEWCGEYILAKRPDVVIHLGDNWDMPSLSSYEKKGSKWFEGKSYQKDVAAGARGLNLIRRAVEQFNAKARREHRATYTPRWVRLTGNHEDRISRALYTDPTMFEGLISLEQLAAATPGWEVVPFLQPINIDGIEYCHYFCSGIMGRAIGKASALLTKKHMSCICGHIQGRDIAYGQRADGKWITALIVGSFYQHEEDYLNPQTNNHWRGVYVLHEVRDGQFDEMPVSLEYLRKRYGGEG